MGGSDYQRTTDTLWRYFFIFIVEKVEKPSWEAWLVYGTRQLGAALKDLDKKLFLSSKVSKILE